MKSDAPDVGHAYDQIADTWRDDRFAQTNGIAQHERALRFLQKDGGRALNVGCGANTRFNALLRARGLILEGIDASARMIEIAREADPDVTYVCGDARDWQPDHEYAFITAWDSIWHVPLTDQRALLLKLLRALAPGGIFIFSAGGTDEPGEHTNSLMGPVVYYATLGIPGLLRCIDEAGCICRHLEFDQHPESHLYLIIQRP